MKSHTHEVGGAILRGGWGRTTRWVGPYYEMGGAVRDLPPIGVGFGIYKDIGGGQK